MFQDVPQIPTRLKITFNGAAKFGWIQKLFLTLIFHGRSFSCLRRTL